MPIAYQDSCTCSTSLYVPQADYLVTPGRKIGRGYIVRVAVGHADALTDPQALGSGPRPKQLVRHLSTAAIELHVPATGVVKPPLTLMLG